MKIDVKETDGNYEGHINFSGFKKDEIQTTTVIYKY